MTHEIDREIETEDYDRRQLQGPARKITQIEIRSIEDIAALLKEIQSAIETHRNNLPREERERIAHLLEKIARDEGIFLKAVKNLKGLLKTIGAKDMQHVRELEDRMGHADGKQKKILSAEIAEEKEKLQFEKAILDLENNLSQTAGTFNRWIAAAMNHLRESPYPYDAKPQLENAQSELKRMFQLADEAGKLEKKAARFSKDEKKLLKKESRIA